MCTLAAKKINGSWFLIKTRDPVPWMRIDDEIKLFDSKQDIYKKLLIQNPNSKEDGYYGGINEKGVAFTATFVPVADNQVSYIRRPYVRLILDASSAKEAIKIIESFNPKIGGNFFVADKDECYEIEGAPNEYFITKVEKPRAKTNHFLHLQYQNLQMGIPWYKKWTTNRLERAQKLIDKAENLEDLENILKDRKNSELTTAICMVKGESDYNPPTASAFVFDTGNIRTYYCQGNPLDTPFKKFDIH
ncbi:MAG: C45 family peptidase [Ignavibacteriaceae bacterium]|jgi:predicted choloylglycine hydrolase|nr:C45 family peptidase [Ignavibacteriaceae bacterium]